MASEMYEQTVIKQLQAIDYIFYILNKTIRNQLTAAPRIYISYN